MSKKARTSGPGSNGGTSPRDIRRAADRLLLDGYAPAALVVDRDLQIIHFQGNTGPFLAPATGPPSFHLLRMVRPELVVAVRSAIQQASTDGSEARRDGIRLTRNGTPATVQIRVMSLKGPDEQGNFLVILEESAILEAANQPGKPSAISVRDLEAAREQLRVLVQDSEAAGETMRVMNEELLAANEELQCANEELETAKEELQSSNEELTRLNEELHRRNTELVQLSDDLSNLLTGINIPILLLDNQLRIRRFTPLAGNLFNLSESDRGRPITDMASPLDVTDWRELTAPTILQSQVVEREVRDREGCWYTLRIRPYKTSEGKIGGVLAALLDIDTMKRSLDQARADRDFADAIVETVREPLLVFDAQLHVVRATGSYYETFGGSPEDTEGRDFFNLNGGQWNNPRLRTLLEELLPRGSRFENFQMECDFPAIGFRYLLLNAQQVHRLPGAPMILLAIEDVTQQKRADLAKLATAQEEERRRIARELHDDTIQRLASLGMDVGRILASPPASAQNLRKELQLLQTHVISAAEVVRGVAYELHSFQLEDLGLEAALRAHIQPLRQNGALSVKFTVRNLPAKLKIEIASCLYRVAQEGLRNVVKHSQSKRATLTLEGSASSIRLCVEDRGAGFAVRTASASPGLGLVGMKERVQLVNGKFSIVSEPEKGTKISVEVPL